MVLAILISAVCVLAEPNSERALNYVNSLFKQQVSGSQSELYQEWINLYQDSQLVNGINYKIVSVWNNTLSNQLELHFVEYFNNFNNTQMEILNHSNPYFLKANLEETQELKAQIGKQIQKHPRKFKIENSEVQKVSVNPFQGIGKQEQGPLEFTLEKYYLSSSDAFYEVYRTTNNTLTYFNYTFKEKLQSSSQEPVKTNAAVFVTFILTFLASCLLTYFAAYVYWAKKHTFPFVKMNEEKRPIGYDIREIS